MLEDREVFLHVSFELIYVLGFENFLFGSNSDGVGTVAPMGKNDTNMLPEHLFIFAREILLVLI